MSSKKTFSYGPKTAAGGTAYQLVIPPRYSSRIKIRYLNLIVSVTQHTLTFMRSLGKTSIVNGVAVGGTSYLLARDPGNYSANAAADGHNWTPSVANNLITANDLILVRQTDGTFLLATVSAATTNAAGQVTVTATASTAAIAAGADVWWFGVTTDTDPRTGLAHPQLKPTVAGSGTSVVEYNPRDNSSLIETIGQNEPLIINVDNTTNASTIQVASGAWEQ